MVKTFSIVVFTTLLNLFVGCGYTILRDVEEEERLAELSAIDSLRVAPDLTIRNVEFKYISQPPRDNPLDRMVWPPSVKFSITIANIGNEDFSGTFALAIKVRASEYDRASYQTTLVKPSDVIPSYGGETVEYWSTMYPERGSIYTFIIMTNPKIQEYMNRVKYDFRPDGKRGEDGQITREFRYDNNLFEIVVPKEAIH